MFSYIATLVGAGFASGQEIVSFFVKFGRYSIVGIVISSVLFALIAYAVLFACAKNKIHTFNEYLDTFCTGYIKRIILIFCGIFSVVCFVAMASGAGEIGNIVFGVYPIIGNTALCGLVLLLILRGNLKAVKYNGIIGAVIVIGIISCLLYIMAYREHQVFYNMSRIAVSAISYAGYNIIGGAVVLVKLSGMLKTRTDCVAVSIISGISIMFIMLLMWWVLSTYYGKINLGELPMLTMAIRQNGVIALIYGILLALAILTTAVSSMVGVREVFRGGYPVFMTLFCALAFGGAGLSGIVNVAYRACGYISIILVIYIAIIKVKNEKNRDI
ncbi:MAG: hypothetical protein IJT23_02475 [Clostridia bacterium]|nr:hypothetical protein [Clostridia bacterium]